MNICIVSLATKELDYMDGAIFNKQQYCKKHNYTFINYTERFSKRHCPWDKIQSVIKNIHLFDYIIWVDADALFNNFSIKFEDIINENPDKDFLFCKDPCYSEDRPHCMINTGVMIFKNTIISRKILEDTWSSCNDYCVDKLEKNSYNGYPHEQGAIANLLRTEEYSNCYYLYEQTKFNTHPWCSNNETFIIHYMGSRSNEDGIKDFVSNVERINKKENI